MSTSQAVNVLRYSALAAGVIYGLYHQRSLNSQTKQAQIDREYNRQLSLIEKAKVAYANRNAPPQKAETGVITDWDNPKFDLEAFLKMKAEEK